MAKWLSRERQSKISEMIGRGYSRSRIRAAMGISETQLSSQLRILGLTPKREDRGGCYLVYKKLQRKWKYSGKVKG